MKSILAIDVGGTHVKFLATGKKQPVKFPSGPDMTPADMIAKIKADNPWKFDAVTIGYPGPVLRGKPVLEPHNLAKGWIDFDFETALGKPVKIINDAAMQALGSYDGGRMLFLGLGTGLGSALIIENVIAPLEVAHLPYKKELTFEDYVGERGRKRLGNKKWHKVVEDVVLRLKNALGAEYVVLGGGNSKKLETLPPDARLGSNENAFIGGFRLWEKK